MACPKGSGATKKLSEVAGTYESTKMKCCKTNVSECAPNFGCACFFCGPIPFSGTPICKSGDNVWASFQVRRFRIPLSRTLLLSLSLAPALSSRSDSPSFSSVRLTRSRALPLSCSSCIIRATASLRRTACSTATAWAVRRLSPRLAAALPPRRRWSARSGRSPRRPLCRPWATHLEVGDDAVPRDAPLLGRPSSRRSKTAWASGVAVRRVLCFSCV